MVLCYALLAAFFVLERFFRRGSAAKALDPTPFDRGTTRSIGLAFVSCLTLVLIAPFLSRVGLGKLNGLTFVGRHYRDGPWHQLAILGQPDSGRCVHAYPQDGCSAVLGLEWAVPSVTPSWIHGCATHVARCRCRTQKLDRARCHGACPRVGVPASDERGGRDAACSARRGVSCLQSPELARRSVRLLTTTVVAVRYVIAFSLTVGRVPARTGQARRSADHLRQNSTQYPHRRTL